MNYEDEKGKLASLLANGKISDQSFLAATRTLDAKIEGLKRTKESPSSQEIRTGIHRYAEIKDTGNFKTHPTGLWFLVPFFFGILGGVVAYVGVKDEDKGMADNLLKFAAYWTLILFLVYWMLFTYLSHL